MKNESTVKKSVTIESADTEGSVIEKRAYQRFETTEGVYAAINPSSYKIGRIVNISLGGLVFKYMEQTEDLESSDKKTIFLENFGFSVEELPFRSVDIELAPDIEGIEVYTEEEEENLFPEIPSPHPLKMGQQRIEFAELTFKQIFAVDKFIRENMPQNDLNQIQVMVE